MFRIPHQEAAVCQTPVSLVSLAATIGDRCSVPISPADGESFTDLIDNPVSTDKRDPIFAEYDVNGSQEKYMILADDMKYTFWMHDCAELYDLRRDPLEMKNVADLPEFQTTVARLKKRLFEWYTPGQE